MDLQGNIGIKEQLVPFTWVLKAIVEEGRNFALVSKQKTREEIMKASLFANIWESKGEEETSEKRTILK